MKILKWWKDVPLGLGAITFKVVPPQEVNESHAGFNLIVEAVKKSDCDYILYEQTDILIERRNNGYYSAT